MKLPIGPKTVSASRQKCPHSHSWRCTRLSILQGTPPVAEVLERRYLFRLLSTSGVGIRDVMMLSLAYLTTSFLYNFVRPYPQHREPSTSAFNRWVTSRTALTDIFTLWRPVDSTKNRFITVVTCIRSRHSLWVKHMNTLRCNPVCLYAELWSTPNSLMATN